MAVFLFNHSRKRAMTTLYKRANNQKNDLEYYDLNADAWWDEGEVLNLLDHFNKSRFEFVTDYVRSWQGLRVLDVGCGGGLACEPLAKRGANVSGIDLSQNSINVAQAHATENHLPIDYRVANAENLPYEDNTFDVVLCFDVLEHVADLERVVSEISRVLKSNGIFLFDTINRNFKSRAVMIWLLEDILKQIPRGLHDWNKFIKPDELADILNRTDFIDVAIKGFDVTNGASLKTLQDVIWSGLTNSGKGEKSEPFKIQINEDTSICYIGKAVKL
jgi:2-polyprenyl-6-hydroxyphenyl methylase/3-demethylubiquinone-9 3-methyltransferase